MEAGPHKQEEPNPKIEYVHRGNHTLFKNI